MEPIAGIAWYRKEQWSRWRQISSDRDEMCASYEDWLSRAEDTVWSFTKQGLEVHKVEIDVDEFLQWAGKENMPMTGYARSEFANQKLGRREMRRFTRAQKPDPTREEVKQTLKQARGLNLSEFWRPYLRRPQGAICPIFRETSAGPEQFGSGVLLRIEHAYFLLTAAHVTDERHKDVLLVPAKKGFVNLYGVFIESAVPVVGSRGADIHDVGVVRFDQSLVDRLSEKLLFLEHDDCELGDVTTAGDAYSIIGYPARKSERQNNTVATDLFTLDGEGVTDKRVDEVMRDPRRHLVIQYRTRRAIHYSTMRRWQSPHPEGMSGGGIFAWSKALPDVSALAQPKLVAILNEYHRHRNVFVGTRLDSYLVAIHRNDPTLPIIPVPRQD